MHRRLASLIGLVAVSSALALWLVVVPLASAGNPCFHGYKIPATTSATGTVVKLEPCAFAPTITSVAVGSTVTFRNGPSFSHLITGASQAWGSPDIEIKPGATVTHTFGTPGIYPYACALHPGMSGVIVVGDLAAAAGGGGAGAGAAGGGAGAATVASGGASAVTTADADSSGLVALAVALGAIIGALVAGLVALLATRRRRPSEASTDLASMTGEHA